MNPQEPTQQFPTTYPQQSGAFQQNAPAGTNQMHVRQTFANVGISGVDREVRISVHNRVLSCTAGFLTGALLVTALPRLPLNLAVAGGVVVGGALVTAVLARSWVGEQRAWVIAATLVALIVGLLLGFLI